MKFILTFHSDPGHGWLEVPKSMLKELGIYDHISPYSYMDRYWTAYLEEDMDAGTFMNAAKAAGWEVAFNEVYEENTPIRNYSSYPAHPDWGVLSGYKTAA